MALGTTVQTSVVPVPGQTTSLILHEVVLQDRFMALTQQLVGNGVYHWPGRIRGGPSFKLRD